MGAVEPLVTRRSALIVHPPPPTLAKSWLLLAPVISTQRPHHVQPVGAVTFCVEFHR
jgi:hypothetical protein